MLVGREVRFLLPCDKSALGLMWDAGVIFNGAILTLLPPCKMDHAPPTANRATKVQNPLISYQLKRSLALVCFSETFGNCCSGRAFLIGTAYMLEKKNLENVILGCVLMAQFFSYQNPSVKRA